MHERKQRMADLSNAFIALPGGWGTLDELAEILTEATWPYLTTLWVYSTSTPSLTTSTFK